MKSIYGITIEDLEEYFLSIGEKKFKALQVYSWLYDKKINSFEEMTDIKKDIISKLQEDFYLKKVELETKEEDELVNKYLFRLSDGNHVEGVLMRHDYGTSI